MYYILVETIIREYREVGPSNQSGTGSAAGKIESVLATAASHHALPLGQGVLTTNLGIPIIVVCTKVSIRGNFERLILY